MKIVIWVVLWITLIDIQNTQAQSADSPTGVYVTTRDFTSLRAGSGQHFARLAIIAPSVTMPAFERSIGTRWIKVDYDGQIGWVASWLLNWTGDIFALPEEPQPIVESATGVRVITQDFSSLRAGPGTSWERLAVVPPGVTLPAVGRSPQARWIQVEYDGQTGWIAYWLLAESGDVFTLLVDGINPPPFVRMIGGEPARIRLSGNLTRSRLWILSHRYSFLIAPLFNDLVDARAKLDQIRTVWLSLQSGASVSCASAPEFAVYRRFSEVNFALDIVLKPSTMALENAVAYTNRAIALFSDACASNQTFIEPGAVIEALDQIATAQRSFNLAESLLDALESR
jgi:uncharacterized protein YraI